MVDPSQQTLLNQRAGGLCFIVEQPRKLDGEHPVAVVRRVEHRGRIRIRTGHRLLAIDVLACLQRCHRHRHMEVVVQAHVHGHDVVAGQELPEVAIGGGDAVHFGHALRLCLVDIRNGDQLGVGNLLVAFDVRLADLPHADDTDPYSVCH